MNEERIIPILTLQLCKGFGTKRIKDIIKVVDTLEATSVDVLINMIKGLSVKTPESDEIKLNWIRATEILNKSKEKNILIIDYLSDQYPDSLKKLYDFPLLLHVKGNFDLLDSECITVVGTRNASEYSIKSANTITKSLSKEDYTIVSGLALGIDTAAHKTAIETNGKTIAVLAHGLQTIFPSENKTLSEEIVKRGGLLLTEYYYGQNYNRGFFIQRDRLQSGFSLATFVIQTSEKGGTMHTAKFSKKQGRPVFVLKHPNKLPNNAGNFKLIDEGAIPIGNDFKSTDMENLQRTHHQKNRNTLDSYY
jgi:DNA processing protein